MDTDLEPVRPRGFDMYPDLRHDACFLACIERIVDGLFHRGEQRLTRVVESQQMAILGEKLADGDIALLCGHCFRSDAGS